MKLKQIASNMTEVTINGVGTILFSYQTPVAAKTPTGLKVTTTKYSVTTSKHITKWLGYNPDLKIYGVDQLAIDNLIGENNYA